MKDKRPAPLGEAAVDGPSVPPPGRPERRHLFACVVICLLVAIWTLHPILTRLDTWILGDAESDAVRGLWGFDHIRRSILPPDLLVYSEHVNFPSGVLALVLPVVTGVVVAPFGALFGPLVGWNLGMVLVLAGVGFSFAWMVRRMSPGPEGWWAGSVCGACLMTQPMLLHGVSDGTPEHVSLWLLPLMFGAVWTALARASLPWGIGGGVLAFLVAFDAPYHAIYGLIVGLIVLPWAVVSGVRRHGVVRLLKVCGAMVGVVLVGGVILSRVYDVFPAAEETSLQAMGELWRRNAADLHAWWQYDFGTFSTRDGSLAPTVIPAAVLWGGIVLTLLAGRAGLPWLATFAFTLVLSFGLNKSLSLELAQWFGSSGHRLGDLVMDVNGALIELPAIGEIRFPRRWLIPAAFSLLAGAGIGLVRLLGWLRMGGPVVALVLVVLGAYSGVSTARFNTDFPMHKAPQLEFADFIAQHEADGAVITTPEFRPMPKSGQRADLPVFANVDDSLSSTDVQYFQAMHGRAEVGYPNLKTLAPYAVPDSLYELRRDWDDLAHPAMTGNPIPRRAYDPDWEATRQRALAELRKAGLRYVVADKNAYGEEGLRLLRRQLSVHTEEEHAFEDGDGVIVFVLGDSSGVADPSPEHQPALPNTP